MKDIYPRKCITVLIMAAILPCMSCALQQVSAAGLAVEGKAENEQTVPGEVLVQFHEGTSSEQAEKIFHAARVAIKKRMISPLVYVVKPLGGSSVPEAIYRLKKFNEVQYAEPNRQYRMFGPNQQNPAGNQ